jgi:hypothetical protein
VFLLVATGAPSLIEGVSVQDGRFNRRNDMCFYTGQSVCSTIFSVSDFRIKQIGRYKSA